MNFMHTLTVYPDEFPEPWASDWGEDEYGLWMGFTYKGVKQLFRWIEPGTFMMGSPKDEPERYEDETQHAVTISQGFWLADCTVTQALWQAAMGTNPSRFKGENLPVENLSWLDVQAFIDKMNAMKPELKLCLPTEVQWEYACRAGTDTTFVFGDNITTDQVNFNGNYPYDDAAMGEYREKNVTVKTLPPNPWGLYEMHGNVWEWCQDCADVDKIGSITDPKKLISGVSSVLRGVTRSGMRSDSFSGAPHRVLRGGSWFDRGRRSRSADRGACDPALRDGSPGFRLARGH